MIMHVRFAPTISGQASTPETFSTPSFGKFNPNKSGNNMGFSSGRNATSTRCVRLGAGLEKILTKCFISFLFPLGKMRSFRILDACAEASSAWEYRLDFGADVRNLRRGRITSKECSPDLCNNIRMALVDNSSLRCTTDQREGEDKIDNLHVRETDVSWTHVYHLIFSKDSERWYQAKTSTSTSGGRREMSRVSLIDEEIWEIAVQRVFVNSQDEVECLGSCCPQ